MEKRRIPPEEILLSYARSSGPGGQNVNKVNSKAVLKWQIEESAVSDYLKKRFYELFSSRISRSGFLVLQSERFRSQERNAEDCIKKLETMAAAALKPTKKRKKTKVPRGADEARLRSKQKKSQKKTQRKGGAEGW